jgi:PKD repeat protein
MFMRLKNNQLLPQWLMLFVFLNAFSSYSQSSGIQISWNFSVGCQVYSNEDPRDGKDPIFIEDIAENECLLTCAGQRVTYTLSGSLGPTPDTTWTVTGGAILNETETTCTVQWDAVGMGSISFSVTTGESTFTKTICIEKIPRPKASFTVLPGVANGDTFYVCSNQTITFENLSIADSGSPIVSYLWDFGDGHISSLYEPTHIYADSGSYIVTLTVTNSCGCSGKYRVVVKADRKGFDIECPAVVCEGDVVTYHLPFEGREICRNNFHWSVEGGDIQNVDQATGDVTVIWNHVDEDGFGYVTFNPSDCQLSCLLPTTIKVPVIQNRGTISGPTSICVGKQYKYVMPQWPTTDFQWEIIDGNNGANANIILTDQRNEIFLEPRVGGTIILKVVYKNTLLNCGGIATLEIKVGEPYMISGPESICRGSLTMFTEVNGQVGNWFLINNLGQHVHSLNNSASFPYTFTTPGNYILSITGANHCNGDPILIKVLATPPAPEGITGETEICPGVPYTYTVNNYDSNFTYEWLPPVNGTIQGSNTGPQVVVVFNTNSTHQVSVKRSTIAPIACSSIATSMNIINKVIPAALDGVNFVCGNSTSNYQANTAGTSNLYTGGETYTWSLSNTAVGSIISGQNTNSISVMWNNVTALTTVTLQCTIQKCTIVQTFTQTIQVRPTPTIAISGYNGPVCSETDINLQVVSTDPLNPLASGSQVNWNANLNSFQGGLSETFAYENTTTGNSLYTITAQVINPNGCGNSTNIATVQVTILPAPDVSISLSSGENAFCLQSQINSELTVATSNNATVEWFYNTNTGLGVTTETYYPTQFGVYTVWAVNPANGCENESDPFIVYQVNCAPVCVLNPAPQVTNDSFVQCNSNGDGGSTISLIGTATQTPYAPIQDYYDILGPMPTAGYTGSSYPVTVAGMYNVLHRAKYECGNDINIYEARKDLLVPYVPQFNYAAVCNGTGNSSFTISVTDNTDFYSPITNRTFAYYIKPTAAPDSSYALALSSANGTFATTYGSGNYTIKLVVTGDYNGATLDSCERLVSFSLQTLPNMNIFSLPPTCHDTPILFSLTSPSTTYNYFWTFESGINNTLQSPTRVFTSSGTYNPQVTVTNRLGCQRTYTSSNVNVPEECFNGDIVATPSNATVCANGSVLMTYQPNGAECGATYQWMNELTPVPGATGISYTATSPGIYWVKLSSAQNCTYSSPSRIAPVFRMAPSVQLSGPTVYCANNFNRNITALTAAGNSISWTVNGQFYGTAPTLNLGSLSVGVYNVTATVTDAFGCQNAAGTVVEIIPLPEPPSIAYSLNNCQPYKVDVFVANAGSGIYNWSNGMGGTANTLVTGGPLEIALTEGGCTVRSQTDIPKDPEFYAWIFPSGCIDACDYKKGFGYLIGPRLPLHYWGWLQDYNVVSEGTGSFPEPFEVTGTGIYNLSYNTGLCNFITEPLDYTLSRECDKCRAIKDIKIDKLYKNETKYCSFTLNLKIENGTSDPMTYTVTSLGPDVVVVPSSVTVQPGSAQIYSFTIIPVNMMNGGSVTLFFEGVDAEGKPCMTEFTFDLPPCDISSEASKTSAAKNNTLSATRQLTIVPNPAKDRVAVHFESFTHNTSLELYDLAGRLLERFEATEDKGQWDVSVNHYPAGLYIVVLRENGVVKLQQKLVKE